MFHLLRLRYEHRCLVWSDALSNQVDAGGDSQIQLEDSQTRLFFSVDLVGSTAYKQTEHRWQPKFLSFYREFPQCLADSLRKQKDNLRKGTSLPKPVFWKAVGDELLYVCPVRNVAQVKMAVDAWLDAQAKYEENTLKKEKLQKTKGAVFAATFPGPDCMVAIPRDPGDQADSDRSVIELNDAAVKKLAASNKMADDEYLLDFLGPSIDTGFRVIAQSTDRYFTMSLEAAWAYSESTRATESEKKNHVVEFLCERQLKGVWGNRPYPIFVIDRMADDRVNIALKKMYNSHCDPERINEIFMACATSKNWPSRLYFKGNDLPFVSSLPKDVIHDGDNSSTDMKGYEEQDKNPDNDTSKDDYSKVDDTTFDYLVRGRSKGRAKGDKKNNITRLSKTVSTFDITSSRHYS